LAAAIRDEFGFESELVRLRNGIFNVYVDGKKIFDKYEEERFPEEREILDTISAMQKQK
jgi:selT/selW/selH-like putative selenoprotein